MPQRWLGSRGSWLPLDSSLRARALRTFPVCSRRSAYKFCISGNWSQDPSRVPEIMDAHVHSVGWGRSVRTVGPPHCRLPTAGRKWGRCLSKSPAHAWTGAGVRVRSEGRPHHGTSHSAQPASVTVHRHGEQSLLSHDENS